MKNFIKENWFKITEIIIVLVIVGVALYLFQRFNYQKKLVKVDACFNACYKEFCNPEETRQMLRQVAPSYFATPDDLDVITKAEVCREKCKEKYAITLEEYNSWKEKQK